MADHRAHRIGERAFGIVRARIADEVGLIGEALIQPDERAIGECPVGVELLDAGRVEVGTQALERRKARPVLHHDGVVVFGESVVEQIGQPSPEIGLAP